MDIKNMVDLKQRCMGVSGFFSAYGSFGAVDGKDIHTEMVKITENGFSAEHPLFSALCRFEEFENGVVLRSDTFTAKDDLTLNGYAARFCLEYGEYEVYTQFSSWQNESNGGWQNLVTGIEVSNLGVRTTDGGVPMVALKNKGNGKILVIHLLPNAQWKIKVSKIPTNGKNISVIIEAGINNKFLNMKVKKGETVEMPKLFIFEAESETDLDSWKLHTVFNRLYPRKSLPVIYNTWLLGFTDINVDNILLQADTAAKIGVEYFVADAGWFGNSDNWTVNVGNWFENQNGGYCGRLKEVSDYVTKKGMKFGLWLEPERAHTSTKAYKDNPEYYMLGNESFAFLDFAKEEARKYITNITLSLIEKYKVKFLKFDFNAPLIHSDLYDGFYAYLKGVRMFIGEIRKAHPDIYITSCASGGNRMDLYSATLYDSFWSSDNQSPLNGFDIFKNTSLRLPPCTTEKWDVRRYVNGIVMHGKKGNQTLPLSCHGATWENAINVTENYTHSFLTGGPIGFSSDIAAYPEYEKQALKEHIAKFKTDRKFYKNAALKILYSTDKITVLQYFDKDFNRIILQSFAKNFINQKSVTVYPEINNNGLYTIGEKALSANEILQNGVEIKVAEADSFTLEITRKV